ncbi:hypothetical protein JL722_621 [Aureococcus anophagefferens]|nr:hypothetical protein JL722_621 [Aureococcus anophagefferens]
MEKSSMESETPAAAVDVEDADDDSVEIAFLDDDDDDESDGGGGAAPADEAAAAGDAGDVPDVDFGDDGGSESSEDEARPAASRPSARCSRRRCARSSRRARDARAGAGVRVAGGTVFVKASSATIFAAKDEASAAVGSVARHGRVKLKIYADKGKKAALSQPSIEGHELVTRAEARIKYHTFVLCCEECEKCTDIKEWDPDWDGVARPEQVMHQLHVFGAGDKRANGEYCRLVCCRGRDRLGDDTRPDEWCEAFNVYDEWNDAPVYVHALHKKIMLRREKINGGRRATSRTRRRWTRQPLPFDEAISAEELYTEAVEMFHDGMPVDRGLKISLYLNRAENRLTRLQPLHRARGWEARDENEWERSQRDFVRDALRDCDFALQLAEDFVVDDEPDARPWVKRAKVRSPSATCSAPRRTSALALGGKNPKIRRTAALVNASIKAQEAKERDCAARSPTSVISQ